MAFTFPANYEFRNPYRPGAGHMPPHLAGREDEFTEFRRLLEQEAILENVVLTGLRGVGKTVLMESFKPIAMEAGWLWVGTDMSEAATVNEVTLATRLISDLSVVTSAIGTPRANPGTGFAPQQGPVRSLDFATLVSVFENHPGLVQDKLKAVLVLAANALESVGAGRVIFAYDEAQNLMDHAPKEQFPLSVLLDVFQGLQRNGCRFMLLLTGLPTLFGKLVDARTYTERMFRVLSLGRLSPIESRDAILKPLDVAGCPVRLKDETTDRIVRESAGYPYFIQFLCKEIYDVWVQQAGDQQPMSAQFEAISRKLDADFFAGRWQRTTDRQRELLWVVAHLHAPDDEFTIQELTAKSRELCEKPFSSSHANQMLASLGEQGLIFKNRFGKYTFAVPLLGGYIKRTYEASVPTA